LVELGNDCAAAVGQNLAMLCCPRAIRSSLLCPTGSELPGDQVSLAMGFLSRSGDRRLARTATRALSNTRPRYIVGEYEGNRRGDRWGHEHGLVASLLHPVIEGPQSSGVIQYPLLLGSREHGWADARLQGLQIKEHSATEGQSVASRQDTWGGSGPFMHACQMKRGPGVDGEL